MSYAIYGLRLIGEREVRYIGQTNGPPAVRLHLHYAVARQGRDKPLEKWLLANEGAVEAIKIAEADSRETARATERAAIIVSLGLKQRLFNVAGVPRELRWREALPNSSGSPLFPAKGEGGDRHPIPRPNFSSCA